MGLKQYKINEKVKERGSFHLHETHSFSFVELRCFFIVCVVYCETICILQNYSIAKASDRAAFLDCRLNKIINQTLMTLRGNDSEHVI